jgi:hypothetical protein
MKNNFPFCHSGNVPFVIQEESLLRFVNGKIAIPPE